MTHTARKPMLPVLLFFSFFQLQAQTDTMIVYDYTTQTQSLILPVPIPTNLPSDQTSFQVGTLGASVSLSQTPPVTNLFPGASFSRLARADAFFNIPDYPVSTAANLLCYQATQVPSSCSATMIGPRMALTAGHCVVYPSQQAWRNDSMVVRAGYNNGTALLSSKVTKIYVFKRYYDNTFWEDIALLELQDPIGFQTGWQSIGFHTDTSYYSNRVFHKFSYPATPDLLNPNIVYTGDTLYYNYGQIYPTTTNMLAIPGDSTVGVPGQSGSPIFYTDNSSEYTVHGVMIFSNACMHYKIAAPIFYQLKHVLEDLATSVKEPAKELRYSFRPNPASDNAILEFENPGNAEHTLRILNLQGETQYHIDVNGSKINIDVTALAPGMYFFDLSHAGTSIGRGKFLVE